MDKSERPVCRAFLPRTYVHHRGVYAAEHIMTQLGLPLSELKTNPDKTLLNMKERAGRDFKALIDETMSCPRRRLWI